MNTDTNAIIANAQADIKNARNMHSLIHEVKPKYFGKNSTLAEMGRTIKTANIEGKKSIGQQMQKLKSALDELINTRIKELQQIEIEERLRNAAIDGSISAPQNTIGSLHPITITAHKVMEIFKKYGCEMFTGPEIDTEWYNFDALNLPAEHPARKMHDTFYMKGAEQNKTYLLRTHTTTVDIKAILSKGVPIRSMSIGKVFRKDLDRTHSPMFHQCDILMVDKNLSLGHLKSLLTLFLKEFFETNEISIRMRPSYFPFTEPSVEIDVRYINTVHGIKLSKEGGQFMEILGCGILSPIVLKNCGVNANVYTGIAAGIGLERLTMLKYGFKDIRDFFKSDINWLDKSNGRILCHPNANY